MKIAMDIISIVLKLVNSQIMLAIPIEGMMSPPGVLNFLLLSSFGLLLNLIVANITDRYTIKIAPLARLANCLNPPVIENFS